MEEKRQYKYATTERALDDLKLKGFEKDFNADSEGLITNPNSFRIVYIYRYEGMSNPDDESTVYGIENTDSGEKGVFVAGNLSFDDNDAARVLLDLDIKGRQEELGN